MRYKWSTQGFTLVELLIVMVILAIVMGLSANGLLIQQKKARDARRKADLEQIRGALEQYRTNKGEYPKIASGKVSEETNLKEYLPAGIVPQDPKAEYSYRYEADCSSGLCRTYTLGAFMEMGGSVCAGVDKCENINDECNYCVTQP